MLTFEERKEAYKKKMCINLWNDVSGAIGLIVMVGMGALSNWGETNACLYIPGEKEVSVFNTAAYADCLAKVLADGEGDCTDLGTEFDAFTDMLATGDVEDYNVLIVRGCWLAFIV